MRSRTGEVAGLIGRPKAYYNIDGVGELGIGFMGLSYALLQWLQIRSPEHSFWNSMYTLFGFVTVMCGVIHFGSRAIKQRITYPRTGFVSYRKRDTVWRPMILGAVGSALFAACFSLLLRRHWDMTSPGSLVGLVLAAAYAYGIARTVRWKWAVAAMLALGSVMIASLPAGVLGAPAADSWILRSVPANLVGALLLTTLLYGALFFISGAVSFVLYLRHTQAPEPEAS